MKNILLFGAGKSATVLIQYLNQLALNNNHLVTLADGNATLLTQKSKNLDCIKTALLNIENDFQRKELIEQADIVISLMPPTLHYLIAKDCIEFSKNLLTASYIDEKTKELAKQAEDKGILFLYEMGLDPGIDHMSAMQIIDKIKSEGGEITSFISHCGGLVAPESDNNPWHYKISWNPRNVVMAGKAGAIFLKNQKQVSVEYKQLFNTQNIVEIDNEEYLAFYPNRDSLSYIETYSLQSVKTFLRTTLRHPEFCLGWKNIIDLNLTNEEKIYDTNGMSLKSFFKLHLDNNGFSKWIDEHLILKMDNAKQSLEKILEVVQADDKNDSTDEIMLIDENGKLETVNLDEAKNNAAEFVAISLNEANISMKQLFYLGMNDDETIINLGIASAADVLQFILEKKLALSNDDKDMIVMLHEFEYSIGDKKKKLKSLLKVKGENHQDTAMAKTVGLPLGIATKLILEGVICEKGLQIPISNKIYEPVLRELQQLGILFKESTFEII